MRTLAANEKPLITWLLSAACRTALVDCLVVSDMTDGGMGSLYFAPFTENRFFGATIAEGQFSDEDGVVVIASLNVDEQGNLYELDVWRTDFEPLMRWPETKDISKPTPNPSFQRTAFGGR